MKTLLIFIAISCSIIGQNKKIPFDSDQWQIQGGEVVEYMGQKALKGNAELKNVIFENGIIEFDMNVTGDRTFAGINFRMKNSTNGEHFYIRPHKTKQVDALQYTPISNGVSSWQLYNGEGYTTQTELPPNEWMHIKLEILGSQGRVFINNMETPAMVMNYLQQGDSKGSLSLFGPANGSVHFANFSYELTDNLNFEPAAKLYYPAGIIKNWKLSQPMSFYKVDINEHPDKQGLELEWQDVYCNKNGLVDISKFTPRSGNEPDVIFAKTIIKSDKDEKRLFTFGYSDAIQIFVNGEIIFYGQSYFRQRDAGFQGIAGLNDAVKLPLKKGDNEILIQIIENMGGWGFYFQDSEYKVIDNSIEELWTIGKDINVPESVIYDNKRDVLYCTNFSGYSQAGYQTISKISPEGKIIKYDWVTGLNRPTGLQIYNDKIYVVDRKYVNVVDIEKAEIIDRYEIPNSVFPNDIIVTEKGVIYVSDSNKSIIFKYENGTFSEWLKGEEVSKPNGMFYKDNTLYWGNTGNFKFKSINLSTGKINVIKTFETAGIDGIKLGKDGKFIISDYDGIIYSVSSKGETKVLIDKRAEGVNQADFEYIPSKDMIVIPSLYGGNTIKAYRYNITEKK